MWQLSNCIHWLHNHMNCCHLDLNLENIMLENIKFTESNGKVSISKGCKVKLCDFGRSELFRKESKENLFECAKQGMSCLEDGISYDARAADIFDLGMILYHATYGVAHQHNENEEIDSDAEIETYGHSAVRSGALNVTIMSKIRNKKIVDLMAALLKIDETERLCIADVLKHEWFAALYAKEKHILRRTSIQKQRYLES